MNNENSCPDKKVMVTETRIIKQSWIIGIIGCIILVFGKTRAFSQHTDTMGQSIDTTVTGIDSLLAMEYIEFLYQKMFDDADALTDEEDHETITDDYEELLTEYEFCRLQPININSESVTRLGEMGLLTVFQIEALRQYRKWYGDLLYIEELFMVEGFDERTIAVMAPVVYCGDNERVQEQERLSLGKIITQGKHQLTLNYARKIEDSEAYSDVDDSLRITKPNTYYLGSPVKLQLKYNYRYGSKLRFGLVMGKDAGEPLFFNHFSDTIQQLVKAYRNPGFDFYGAHLYMNDLRILRDAGEGIVVRDLALGDYQLSFGQGLTLWSGMSFGKAPGGSSVIKRGAGVRPKASAGEGRFFRGLAATLTFRGFQATAFYSQRRIDATILEADTSDSSFGVPPENSDESLTASALQETGQHRSLGELAKRHTMRQQVFGGRLAYASPYLEVGCTVYHTRLGTPLYLKPSKYNQFYFQGDRLTMSGIDFRWQLDKAVFFGELSMSDNIAFAGLAGMTVKPAGYIDFTVMYRNYGTRYQNLFFGAVKESSRGQAEEGFYLGLQCAPAPRWNLLAHCDFFRLKWLSSQAYALSWGQEYDLKVVHQITHSASLQLKFKTKTKMKNSIDDHTFSYYPVFYTKRTVQFQLSYTLGGCWVFSNKASYSHYSNDDGIDSRGYLLCQDVAYKPDGKPYSLAFRYALFDTDDYNSRISVYENDVLGTFSIPNLSSQGSRVYLLGKLKLFNMLSLYAKVGCSFLSEETKADVKAEAVWKF